MLLQALNEGYLRLKIDFEVAAVVFSEEVSIVVDVLSDFLLLSRLFSIISVHIEVHVADLGQRPLEKLEVDKCEE